MNMRQLVVTALGLLWIAVTTAAHSAPMASPVVLVSSGSGVESYGETVVLALPLEDGSHVGFVLNRPTEAKVSDLFPGDDPSITATARVDIGGPYFTAALFALVVDPDPGVEGLRRVTSQFSVALDADAVDRVIAKRSGNARYFIGLFAWMPGGLEEQVEAGAWNVLAPDARIVLSAQPATLWPRLSRGSARYALLSR